jgi:TolA-binding protein
MMTMLPSVFRSFSPALKGVVLGFVLTLSSLSMAQAQSAFELYQDRLVALEESLKEVRGIVEEDFRALKQSIADNAGKSAELDDLENKIEKMIDRLGALNNRIERTLEVASDNEFRLLRLEKRLDSLMRMGVEGALAFESNTQTSPSGSGVGDVPKAGLNVNENNETVWTMEKNTFNEEVQNLPNPDDANLAASDEGVASATGDNATSFTAESSTITSSSDGVEAVKVSVLPEGSPEEQYRFALSKALQNDLVMAEQALSEFVEVHPEHERSNDATFWLGRVQFMQGSYEQAAMTFTSFNTQWPTDARREKTTLWIAESISYFAAPAEVCDLLTSLPNLIEDPTDNFFDRLNGLKEKSECRG